jgi:hypothetical protein
MIKRDKNSYADIGNMLQKVLVRPSQAEDKTVPTQKRPASVHEVVVKDEEATRKRSRDNETMHTNDSNQPDSSKRQKLAEVPSFPEQNSRRRFACPFYKHDPDESIVLYRSCRGPGWPTVHRVK